METYDKNYERKKIVTNWAANRFSVAEEIAQEYANHWLDIHDDTAFTNEELVMKMLPMAIDILKKHPDFTKSRHWEF
jgi:hypothetical protein